jgi:hypothetical protein
MGKSRKVPPNVARAEIVKHLSTSPAGNPIRPGRPVPLCKAGLLALCVGTAWIFLAALALAWLEGEWILLLPAPGYLLELAVPSFKWWRSIKTRKSRRPRRRKAFPERPFFLCPAGLVLITLASFWLIGAHVVWAILKEDAVELLPVPGYVLHAFVTSSKLLRRGGYSSCHFGRGLAAPPHDGWMAGLGYAFPFFPPAQLYSGGPAAQHDPLRHHPRKPTTITNASGA